MSSNNPAPYDPYNRPTDLAARPEAAPAAYMGAPPSGGAGPTTGIIQRTLLAVYRFKWMILAIVILGTGAGFVAVRFQTPVYQTSAKVWFGAGLSGGGQTGPIRQGTVLDNAGWQFTLRSSAVLDSVIYQQRLFLVPANPADSVAFTDFRVTEGKLKPGSYSLELEESGGGFVLNDDGGNRLQRGAFGDSVGGALGFKWVPSRATMPQGRPLEFTVLSPGGVSADLVSRLDFRAPLVQGKIDENFLTISLQGTDPVKITAVLQAIMVRFEEVALELKTERLSAQTEILEEQLHAAEAQLNEHEAAYQGFLINTATLPNEVRGSGAPLPAGLQMTDNTVFGSYFSLNTQKDQYLRDSSAIQRALTEHSDGFGLVTALEMIPSVTASTELKAALSEAADAESRRRALEVTLTPENPQVLAVTQFRDSLLQRVIPQYARTLTTELSRQVGDLDDRIANTASELREIPQRSMRGAQLQRQRVISEDLYRELESRYQTSRLAEVTQMPDMQILDQPKIPPGPVTDTRRNLFLMFIAGAVGLGLGLAVLRDRVDPRVQYPDQVTAGMGLNILGAVPALRGGRLGSGDMALAVEAFRSIQLSLTHAVGNGGPLTVTFSSPGASDGKSFVTSNLAIAFADMGHRTLVIDGDVRRGTMHKLLGATHKPGLTDYLSGRTDRGTIVQETRYPLLHFIGCGSRQDAGPKLLGSPTMRKLMRDLRADYDVILVDSPPLGACVDPMILATLTRNIVLVVRSGSTDRSLAESKLDALDRLPVRVVGAVLNDVTQGGPYRYYSYVSGYEVLDDENRALLEEAASAEAEEDQAEPTDRRTAAGVAEPDQAGG